MSNRNNSGLGLLAVFAVTAVAALALWKAAGFMGLPFATTAQVILTSAVAIGIYAFAIYASKKEEWNLPMRILLWPTVPLLVALLWFLWWPALDQWSMQALNHGPVQSADLFVAEEFGGPKWYAHWGTKLGGIVLCLSAYFPKFWNRDE